MRDGSPLGTKHERSMTALPTAGSEVEVKPVLAGIPPARLRNSRSFTSHPNTYLCDQQDFPIVVAGDSDPGHDAEARERYRARAAGG